MTIQEVLHNILKVNRVETAIESVEHLADADVVVFGPYGNGIPSAASYIRVAYICENYKYDGPPCDYLFSVSMRGVREQRCARIQWHGIDPRSLVKPDDLDVDAIAADKDRFCAFLYSNRVPYREEIFRRLSKYKRVDAPGKSMTNMDSIDKGAFPGESRWETKRRFLSRYKFTLALENEVFPGYQTEKLYDAMRAFSVPIYCGDPDIGKIFNTDSFINVGLGGEVSYWIERLQDFSQMRWSECQGGLRYRLTSKVMRRLRILSRDHLHKWYVSKIIDGLVDRVVDLDRDLNAYMHMLRQPWLKGNVVPDATYSTSIWQGILADAVQRQFEKV